MGFQNLDRARVNHFKNIYKEDQGSRVDQMMNVIDEIPIMVNEDKNNEHYQEVTLKELHVAIQFYKMIRSHGLGGWLVEFFKGFLNIFEK